VLWVLLEGWGLNPSGRPCRSGIGNSRVPTKRCELVEKTVKAKRGVPGSVEPQNGVVNLSTTSPEYQIV